MLNQEKAKDYVLSSGETHSIREFINKAFETAGIVGMWHGKRTKEELSLIRDYVVQNQTQSSVLVKINEKFYRPAEVDLLLGDSTPARTELNWKPKVTFNMLVEKMVENDIELLTNKSY